MRDKAKGENAKSRRRGKEQDQNLRHAGQWGHGMPRPTIVHENPDP